PRDIRDFTARGPALDGLLALADGADPAYPPVAVISGQPGLGKTSLAVHAAHLLASRFPDGQFALDLHGMSPEPARPRDALARLLAALGTAQGAIPTGTDDRAGLLRSVLGDRRVLLLLDNAKDESQVRPFLPGTGTSLTLVTSRHALAGLEAVHRTDLAVFRREESVELLSRVIGPERVGAESQAARDLTDLCGQLPLAVRIAGQRLLGRPRERLAKLVGQLAAEERRLDTLQAGDLGVRAAFALSYRQLAPATRTLLRRAALAAGPDFSPRTAGLLAGLPCGRAADGVEELVEAGLLQPDPVADRYRFHDLLALFAGEQLAAEDGPEECAAAEDRTARWMLRRATAAARRFDADRHLDAPDDDPEPASAPAGQDEAAAWLEAERNEWLAALHRAARTGDHQRVVDAAEAMHWFSDRKQHWELWVEVFRLAVDAARALGDRSAEAAHLNHLAWACNVCVYDHHAALDAADTAFEVAGAAGDELQTAWALGHGAGALHRMGRIAESQERLRDAADRFGAQTSPQARLGELTILNSLGNQLRQSGRADEALEIHRRGESLCATPVPGESAELMGLYRAVARHQIGSDLAELGRWGEAETPLRQALGHFEAAGMPAWSEPARLDLGRVLSRLARYEEAGQALRTAHGALGELNSPRLAEAEAELHTLAELVG
ncbi:NB-ARC domain-containing protein, partial [Streptomyces boluensis]